MTVGLISPPAEFCVFRPLGLICTAKENSKEHHGKDFKDQKVGVSINNYSRYQCLGNHDIVPGQSGVDFQTKVAPLYDNRWYFVGFDKYFLWNIVFTSG